MLYAGKMVQRRPGRPTECLAAKNKIRGIFTGDRGENPMLTL